MLYSAQAYARSCDEVSVDHCAQQRVDILTQNMLLSAVEVYISSDARVQLK